MIRLFFTRKRNEKRGMQPEVHRAGVSVSARNRRAGKRFPFA